MKTTANGPVGTVNPLVPKDRRKHYTAPVRPGNALPGAAGIPLARRTAEGRDQPVRPLVPGSGAKLTTVANTRRELTRLYNRARAAWLVDGAPMEVDQVRLLKDIVTAVRDTLAMQADAEIKLRIIELGEQLERLERTPGAVFPIPTAEPEPDGPEN